MNILVTGGSGFIGRHVCQNLLHRGHHVLVYDVVKPAFDGVIHMSGCMQDKTKLWHAIEISDAVMHLAGVLGTAETVEDPLLPVNVNVIGSVDVFEACRQFGKRGCYIAVGNHFMNNSYAITKTAAERFALMYNTEHGTKIAVVRGLNAYGPYQKAKPVRKVIPNFVIPALKNEPIVVYGSGEQIMDFIYVTDIAEILCRALLDVHGLYDRIFEAGSGQRTTINQIARLVIELSGSSSKLIHESMRAGEVENSVVLGDIGTLLPLNFRGRDFVPIRTGLAKTIEYYREHLEQYA